jgi:hypothetical protein
MRDSAPTYQLSKPILILLFRWCLRGDGFRCRIRTSVRPDSSSHPAMILQVLLRWASSSCRQRRPRTGAEFLPTSIRPRADQSKAVWPSNTVGAIYPDFPNWRSRAANNPYKSRVLIKRSSLQCRSGRPRDFARGGDPWRGLGWQFKVELADEELLIGVQLGVAAEDQSSPLGGWEVDIEHLDSGKLVEYRSGCEAACERPESCA